MCGCGAGSADGTRQENEVQGGTRDTSPAHNFAVGVTNGLGSVCSGTLIAPNLVLTARHCVVPPTADDTVSCKDAFGANVAPATVSVTTQPNIARATSRYEATEIVTPVDVAFCGNDIALILLATNVPATEALPAVPVVQFKLTDRRLSGTITALGYGYTNPSATDSGQRRLRENIPLLCIPGSAVMDCGGKLTKYASDAKEFITEGYVCAGDSGSGAFDQRTFNRGTPYVLGALSRGPQTADTCLAAIYSRTDAHAQLIIDAGKRAAAQGKYSPPALDHPRGPFGGERIVRGRVWRRALRCPAGPAAEHAGERALLGGCSRLRGQGWRDRARRTGDGVRPQAAPPGASTLFLVSLALTTASCDGAGAAPC